MKAYLIFTMLLAVLAGFVWLLVVLERCAV